MDSKTLLPVPSIFNAKNAADRVYSPDIIALPGASERWRKDHSIKVSGSDLFKIHLLLIDLQKDFCFPTGTLYVGGRSGNGAIEDNVRIAEFIYRNLGILSYITPTMDTHFPFQIFFGSCWTNQEGNELQMHTMVDLADDGTLVNTDPAGNVLHENVLPHPRVAKALAKGNYSWLCAQWKFYCEQLAKAGKYKLYLWPPHCMLGSDGHALAGVIQEARLFHAYVRGVENMPQIKGGNFYTENYSIFEPEVLGCFNGGQLPGVQKNTKLFETLVSGDAIVIAGQAKSHCTAWTIDHLLRDILAQDPSLAKKVYLLEDCASNVVVPNMVGGSPDFLNPVADFTDAGDAAFQKFADAGMNLVKSTDPIESWPGITM